MLSRFFRPKWQHRDPAVRLAAIRELGGDDPQLLQLARSDGDLAVRQQAIRQLVDLDGLFSLYCEESERPLREVAGKRLKRLLSGGDEAALSLPQRLEALARFAHEELSGELLLLQATEVALRRQLIEQVQRQSLLAEVALNDEVAELRLRALERVDRPQTLERIARQSRGRDKNVARLARERLEALRAEEERPRRRLEAVETMERLVAQGAVDLIAFRRLQEAWRELGAGAEPSLGERFEAAAAAFVRGQEERREEALLLSRQRELCERCEQLLQGLESPQAELNGIDTALEMLELSWRQLAAEGRATNPALEARFFAGLGQLQGRCRERREQQRELACLQATLEQMNALCAGEGALAEETIATLEQRWQQCGGGRRAPHSAALFDAFGSACAKARSGLAQRREQGHEYERELAGLLTQLDQALQEGQLQTATSLNDRSQARYTRLEALGSPRLREFSRRLGQARGRLLELRDWRRFGTNQARDELLARMAGLQGSSLPPRALAAEIKSLQEAWRDLDRKDGAAPDALWQRFEQAAESAYAPCRAFYQEQERQREENYEKRRCFLEQLEREYEAIDWASPQWTAIDKALRRAHQRWRQFEGVGPEQWQELNGRFRAIDGRYEQHLAPQREQERARREGLIALVSQLAEEPDLDRALEQTREAQGQWSPQVGAPPRIEQALWRRFKEACDTVYARQRAQQQNLRNAEQENKTRKLELCERFEQLAAGAHDEWEQACSEAESLRQQWRAIGKISPAAHKALETRMQRAEKVLEQAGRRVRAGLEQAQRQLLAQKAAACEGLEALLWEGADEAALTATEEQWSALAPLQDGALEQALQGRFERTRQALRQGGEAIAALQAAAPDQRRQAEALLLQLEILAGIDSPAEFAAARLALQVELLPEAMTAGLERGEGEPRLRQLRQRLLQCGPLPAAAVPPLQRRLAALAPFLD